MQIELTNEVDVVMYLLDCKTGWITPIHVVRESKSRDTVETDSGRRYRTDTKSHKLFYSYEYAVIASKRVLGNFDDEYHHLLERKGLIHRTAA